MKYIKSLIFLAPVCLFCFGCAPTSLIQSSRQTAAYNINQLDDLTGDTSRSVHGEQNVLYSLSNDNTYLYITLMIADPKTQNKVLHNGFTLWIDTTGHKKQAFGIAYPLPTKGVDGASTSSASGYRKKGETQDEPGYENKSAQIEMKRRMILTMTDMDLIRYKGKAPVRVTAASNHEGISVALLIDSNGALQYHAIIPFTTMHYHPEIHTGKNAKPLTVALTTNKEDTHKASEKANPGNSGTPMGGMGGPGGMGSRGGGGYSDPANEPVDVWMHVKLAGY